MIFLSAVLRFIFKVYQSAMSNLRVTKLKLLYPGATIDYKTKIDPYCSIVCVKGGKLEISNCSIKSGTLIFADSSGIISIRDSFIGRNCVITSKEKVTIKPGCLIAEMVVVRDQDHFLGDLDMGQSAGKFTTGAICIEENVWLAARATVLKGVTIGPSSVVAASAVVITNVPAGELWGGIPARFIKKISSFNSIIEKG